MRVLIDGVLAKTGYFDYDEVVLNNTCYESIENITVQSKNFKKRDGWVGSITVTYKGEPIPLECSNCRKNTYGNLKFGGLIVVDEDPSNGFESAAAPTACVRGEACTLKISTKKGIVIIFDR